MGSTPVDFTRSEHEHEYMHTHKQNCGRLGRTPADIYILSLSEFTQRVFEESRIQKLERVEAENQFMA
jgi:hypothetical protein